ncbi:MAG: hypothetical protein HY080_17695 [Gammaproteobacteria bacterium]|nr:hypothetical protein [Gammaproteobacteria bacterium]
MSLRSRLEELPSYESRESQVAAGYFNLVKVALNRLDKPLRFELPRLRTLELILEADAWVVVDCALNDFPIVAWLNFATQRRSTLHQPIPCQRRTYHAHATMIVDRVLDALPLIVGEQLSQHTALSTDNVLALHPRRRD